jgi:hypothetical protein
MDSWGLFPKKARDFSFLHIIKTASGAHAAFCQWVLGALSPRVMCPGCELTTDFYLVPRFKCVELYLHFHIYLCGEVLN